MTDELWEVHRGEQPVLATAIHAGHELRADVAELVALSEAERLREEDPGTDAWTRAAANRISVRRSRFEVDLNRPPQRAVYRVPEDAWGLEVWRSPPPEALVERSLGQHHAFYDLSRAIMADIEQKFGPFVVLDLHAYNHRRAGPGSAPSDPRANPVVNVGTGSLDRHRWASLVDRFIADLSRQVVAGERLEVRENVRFQGGHFPRWANATFGRSGCAIAIEVKKTYMDEWTGIVDRTISGEIESALEATVPGLVECLGEM